MAAEKKKGLLQTSAKDTVMYVQATAKSLSLIFISLSNKSGDFIDPNDDCWTFVFSILVTYYHTVQFNSCQNNLESYVNRELNTN